MAPSRSPPRCSPWMPGTGADGADARGGKDRFEGGGPAAASRRAIRLPRGVATEETVVAAAVTGQPYRGRRGPDRAAPLSLVASSSPVGVRNAANVMRPADTRGRARRGGRVVRSCGSRLLRDGGVVVRERPAQGAVRPVTVVVAFELVQHGSGVSLVDDQEAVEELAADCPDEALGDRIRSRCRHRRLDDPDVDGGEDGVDSGGEPAVSVSDEEPEAGVVASSRSISRLRASWVSEALVGWAVTPRMGCNRRRVAAGTSTDRPSPGTATTGLGEGLAGPGRSSTAGGWQAGSTAGGNRVTSASRTRYARAASVLEAEGAARP